MRPAPGAPLPYSEPRFLSQARELAVYLRTLSLEDIARVMKLSEKKAAETKELIDAWSTDPARSLPAIDAFIGDIYSGLQVQTLSEADRAYAHEHLVVLSGLYGGLRALDSVAPYRLEMGYRLTKEPYRNLYAFWGDTISQLVSSSTACVINLSALEYTKALLPYLEVPVIAPKFMTVSPKTGEPTFVVVHAKIARGAFARWLLVNRVDDIAQLPDFTDLGYEYSAALSTPEEPVFVCQKFGGLGLSVRLT